jgi:ADP-ribose pyrophosphatase
MHVYLATGLHADPLPGDADEFLSVDRIPVEQVYDMVQTGGVRDAKSLAALFLARPLLLG